MMRSIDTDVPVECPFLKKVHVPPPRHTARLPFGVLGYHWYSAAHIYPLR